MAGKRYDQYQIDPAEAGATDYKNLARPHDLRVEEEKRRFAETHRHAEQPFLPAVPAPSKHARRGRPTTQDSAAATEPTPPHPTPGADLAPPATAHGQPPADTREAAAAGIDEASAYDRRREEDARHRP